MSKLQHTGGLSRRAYLAAASAAALTGLTGCLGDDGAFHYVAGPASVDEAALEDAGYGGEGPTESRIEETVSVAGFDVDVTLTTWSAVYASERGEGSFVALSTPDVTLAGQSVNPLGRLSNDELLARALDHLGRFEGGDVSDLRQVGTEQRTVLGSPTRVSSYLGTVESEAGDQVVRFHLANRAHAGDVVVLLGVHSNGTDEAETLLSLMEAVEHEGAD